MAGLQLGSGTDQSGFLTGLNSLLNGDGNSGISSPLLDGTNAKQNRFLQELTELLDGNSNSEDGGLFSSDSFFGNKDETGWGTGVFSLASAGLNSWLGLENLSLAEDTLDFQKDAWNKNFETQQKLTNTQMADRQAARVSANPGAYESVDSYMATNSI